MSEKTVWLEVNGFSVLVGRICGDYASDASFSYAEEYLVSPGAVPVSVSLPLSDKEFSPDKTKTFFEGLLPEGFTRREVARQLHANEDDYLSILSELGKECIGAIRILSDEDPGSSASYEELSIDQIRALAEEGATKSAEIVTKTHLSLTGASGKVGLYLDASSKKWYLPHGDAPSTHIVKQSHVRLNDIVVNERMMMLTANSLGIDTASCNILNCGGGTDGEILFSTKRYDRVFPNKEKKINGLARPNRLHQEDFAQAMGIPSSFKYEESDHGYLKKMFDIIRQNSTDPITDQLALWDRIVFNYLIGNTDAHIKNYSLLYDEGLKNIRLAPAYDILSTVVYNESTRNMSFFIGGEINLDRISDACFERAAKEAGVGRSLAMKHLDALRSGIGPALRSARDQLVAEGFPAADRIYESMKKLNII